MSQPLVNLTLPVFNEEAQLEGSITRLVAFLREQGSFRWEIVIADNGSTDRTSVIARRLAMQDQDAVRPVMGTPRAPDVKVRYLRLAEAGRGRALKVSWLDSGAEVLGYMDIDLSTDLAHLPRLIGAVARGECDLAVGSRRLAESRVTRCWKREWLSRGYNALLRGTLGLRVRDAQCGFKAISRAAAQALLPRVEDPGWFFDTELLVRTQWGGWRTVEIPVHWIEDPDSRVRLASTIFRDLRGIWRLMRSKREAREARTRR